MSSDYYSLETETDTDISDDGSEVYPVKKPRKISITDESDTNDEENVDGSSLEQWNWKSKNNQPKIWIYTETPGIKATINIKLNENSQKLDFFNEVFDKIFWEILVMETNRYAEQSVKDESKSKKINETWVSVNCDEMKVYFALCIIMAQVRKPNIQMNWTKRTVVETPIFRKTMSHNRFLQITKFLQFTNYTITGCNNQENDIKAVANFFNKKFKEIYIMEEDIAIHDYLVKFNRRLSYEHPKQSKRTKFSIKFYKLCESASNYCYHFKICTANDKLNPEDSEPENVVMELMNSLLLKGHTLYLDSWYTSPNLFLRLINNRSNAIGEVDVNKKICQRILAKKLKKGLCEMRSCNGILALKWKDVHILSTKHDTIELCEERQPDILKPKCIIDYNKGMSGIDNRDQKLACFPIMRKHMKGYRKIFFTYSIWPCIILTFSTRKYKKKKSYAEYRIDIAELLLKTAKSNTFKQISTTDSLERLRGRIWAHFPKHIDPTPSKQKPSRTCKVCSKHKKRSETTWECKKCKVALHVPDCFEKYHTLKNF